MITRRASWLTVITFAVSLFVSQAFAESSVDILRQGLLGAGTGAISAGLSGGKAGKGALIGAGTNVIGGALLNVLTGPSTSQSQPVYYSQPVSYVSAPVIQQPVYQPEPVYVQSTPTYSYAPQEDSNKKILRQGLLGAGVGAISAEASGGKAGTGALVGAGTNVIGGALLDTLMTPSTSQPTYYSAPPYAAPFSPASSGLHKHVIRKYDASGHVVSEEEFWQ